MTHWGSQVRVLYSPLDNTASLFAGPLFFGKDPLDFGRRRQSKKTIEDATLAQLIERLICNLQVLGLNPRGGFRKGDSGNVWIILGTRACIQAAKGRGL